MSTDNDVSAVLDKVFSQILKSNIFINREVLRPDYIPDELPHREEQIAKLGSILAPSLRGYRPSNVFIYGLTGTGKTAVTKYVIKKLYNKAVELGLDIIHCYINTRQDDTTYRVILRLAECTNLRLPFTGISTAEAYRRFLRALDSRGGIMIVVLDEIDFLIKRQGDELLYRLTRSGDELHNSKISIIGITNDLKLVEDLDPRVRSSLGEIEMVFPPYNAIQLEDILKRRAKMAFNPNAIDNSVISLCAALAAREHGDARRALDLLRVAGEIAEREGSTVVTRDHVYKALKEIERDRVGEVIMTMPLHSKLVLLSILYLTRGGGKTTTGDVYTYYKSLCSKIGIESVTQRRVSDIIGELDMAGIITAKVISRGRYGKTRIISLAVPEDIVIKTLKEDPYLEPLLSWD
ncbi:ORC complex protein Cdc6/Orc1 [Ignisphaera aggregans DSM 17230]|uniref:ORC1-type DNA replication protein n=1 Tax=Ignisphaera aggregans (strain DSM 17230 / JCM 13409 / AQ1.S1) TaxID=583356 RepID=E0SP36_IGNAA|nr:ORC complex protein Cdc6/Orc1 [Ignisphaera aggregans DSM 17230]